MIVVEIPGQPQGKGRLCYRVVRPKRGKAFASGYTPKATRSYEETVAAAGRLAMREAGRQLMPGPLRCRIYACFEIPSSWSIKKREQARRGEILPTIKPDADNIAKSICDALNHVAFFDDKQIVDCRVHKFYGNQPKVRVEIEYCAGTSP